MALFGVAKILISRAKNVFRNLRPANHFSFARIEEKIFLFLATVFLEFTTPIRRKQDLFTIRRKISKKFCTSCSPLRPHQPPAPFPQIFTRKRYLFRNRASYFKRHVWHTGRGVGKPKIKSNFLSRRKFLKKFWKLKSCMHRRAGKGNNFWIWSIYVKFGVEWDSLGASNSKIRWVMGNS